MSVRQRGPLAPVSSTTVLRHANVATIARLLHVDGPLTRADIGRVTGLARPTVQAALRELVADGTVREVPSATTAGPGRPATAFVFDHRQASVAVCRRRDDRLEVVLADLSGEVVAGPLAVSTPPLPDLGAAVARACDHLRAGVPTAGPVAAVTVLLPGEIERRGGRTTVTDPANGWQDEPVVELLEAALGVPVRIATPAAAGLAGVAWRQRGTVGTSGARSALLVFLDHGLAASACVAGTPAFGASGDGGEIGHHVVVPDGDACRCGRRGCLETLAAGWAVRERVAALRPPVEPAATTTLAALEALGRPDVGRVLADAATALGGYVAVLVTALEPDRVLLGGTDFAAGAEGFLATFRTAVEARRARVGRHTVGYEFAPADADLTGGIAAALGALPPRWRDAVVG